MLTFLKNVCVVNRNYCSSNFTNLLSVTFSQLFPLVFNQSSENLPQICQLGVGTDAQGLGVGAHGVDVPARVELCTSHRLGVLQRGNWNKPGPPGVALAIAVRSGERLKQTE